MQFAAGQQFGHVAAAGARRPDAGEIDRAVADVVIAVAAEILGREFPIARDQPFLDAAQHLGLALAPVAAVEDQVEIAGEAAEIFGERRRGRVPGGPHAAFVDAELRHLDQAPLRAVELRVIGLAEIRHADQLAVGAVAPAMIGAGENGRVALVVAAHLHAAMAARIQEHMDLRRRGRGTGSRFPRPCPRRRNRRALGSGSRARHSSQARANTRSCSSR